MTNSYSIRNGAEPLSHQVYELYIKKLGLKNHHHSNLIRRGLNSEQILKAQYATKPRNNVMDAIMALGAVVEEFGDRLNGIAGYSIEKNQRAQSAVAGLLIPCRDMNGRIHSLLARVDDPKINDAGKSINKYMHFSSASKPEGAKVWPKTHCPIIKGHAKAACGAVARLTEGALKADIATALGEFYTFGLHGLNIQDDFASIIDSLEVFTLRIAFDSGEDDNADMIRGKAKAFLKAKELGIDAEIELWDSQYGKGIDDVLAAGHEDKIRLASKEEVDEILAKAKMKPRINVIGGGLSDQATQGENAIIDAGLPIYQRGTKLVTPILQPAEASHGRKTVIAVLHEILKGRLVDDLCEVASWVRINDAGNAISINPPPNVAETILCRFGKWKFPSLAGVLLTPTLRPDGSLLKDIGYDPATRLFLLDAPPMPDIPEMPTRDDAIAALALLESLLVDFPFVDEASRSVALSVFMTPVVRGACKVVPMHVISAPTPGTGKSYLLDTSAAIAIGQICPIIAAGRNEEETEKRLGAALLTGQSILSIDNCNDDLGGDALCQMVERPSITLRILGQSLQITIESRSTIFANGNNIRVTGDMVRRVVQCTLDAGIERPEFRDFKTDPVKLVLDNRGKYIAAVLTIVRAYIVAGKPDVILPRLASFEEWSDLVRSSLVWLGRVDPLVSMETARVEDPVLQTVSEVFMALWEVTKGERCTAKVIIEKASVGMTGTWDEPTTRESAALREALKNAAGDAKGVLTTRRVGQWLSRYKGRVCNNLRLENKVDEHGHPAEWWLIESGSAVKSG